LSIAQLFTRGDDWQPAKGQWPLAIEACRSALRLDPTNLAARRLLIVGAVMTGDRALARTEYQAYLGFKPSDAGSLGRWLDAHPASRAGP
jgi:hypothetical protein